VLQHLGGWALRWQRLAQGLDDQPVSRRTVNRQSSREITFERDTRDGDKLRRTLADMSDGLARTLHSTGAARCVHIKIRYSDFRTITRQRRTNALTESNDVARHAMELLGQWWDGRPVRLIGVGLSNFVTRPRDQLSLFGDDEAGETPAEAG
jgi:DNA polymerase-4